MKLSSDAWINGLYYKPRTDLKILKKYKKGLIVTTACFNNDIAKLILKNKIKKAMKRCELYRNIFGKNFYLEIQPHDLDGYRKLNLAYVRISIALNIPLVSTNDCHYPTQKDSRVQDILLLIQTKKTLKDVKEGKDVFQFSTKEFWLKTRDEMLESYKKYHPDLYMYYKDNIIKSMDNANKIAEMCNVEIPLGTPMIPNYGVSNPDKLFKKFCEKGWSHKIQPKMGIRRSERFFVPSTLMR
jgi:DNA polymerase-3 subunit alpha